MGLKSKREAAEILGLSTRGIERAVRRGNLAVEYRDSRHGKKAWFNPHDLARYKQQQESRGAVGFTSGIPPHQPPSGPTIGTVIPMVNLPPWPAKGRQPRTNAVPIADRLTLTLNDAVQLSGLPRSFVVQSVHNGKLKSIKVGRTYFVKRSSLDEFVRGM
jgi:excisionase family DNA binding protein